MFLSKNYASFLNICGMDVHKKLMNRLSVKPKGINLMLKKKEVNNSTWQEFYNRRTLILILLEFHSISTTKRKKNRKSNKLSWNGHQEFTSQPRSYKNHKRSMKIGNQEKGISILLPFSKINPKRKSWTTIVKLLVWLPKKLRKQPQKVKSRWNRKISRKRN